MYLHAGYTNNAGEVQLTTFNYGEHTVKVEYDNLWCAKSFEVTSTYRDVDIDLSNAQQTLGLPFGYTTVIILCVASVLMTAGVITFIQSRKKR
jgi:hypothetical protein